MRKLVLLPLVFGLALSACSESEKHDEFRVAQDIPVPPTPGPTLPAPDADVAAVEKQEVREALLPYLSDDSCEVTFAGIYYETKKKYNETLQYDNEVSLKLRKDGTYLFEVKSEIQHFPKNTFMYTTTSYASREGQWSDDYSMITLSGENGSFGYLNLGKIGNTSPAVRVKHYDYDLSTLELPYTLDLEGQNPKCNEAKE